MLKHIALATVGFVLAGAAAALAGEDPTKSPAQKVRIGTYDTRAVALAYMRSRDFKNGELPRLQAELKKAEEAGDARRIDEARKRADSAQRMAHAQVFSNAPIGDIMLKLRESLPALAKKANVVAIVPPTDWNDETVELVDVTDTLVQQFKPDEPTRKLMADIRRNPPISLVEAVMMKD